MKYLLVGLGGMAGSMLRYWVSVITVSAQGTAKFPLATFLVNVVGSFVIGVMMALLLRTGSPQGHYHLLGVVGFCGGFTTFSSFSLEVMKLFRTGDYSWALFYVLISVLLCVTATWLGMMMITKLK